MREGLLLSETTLARTGLRLLALLYAEYEWGQLRREGDDADVLDNFTAESSDLISEDLLTIAAMARAQDDEFQTLSLLRDVFPNGVGRLHIGNKTKVLTPREACNKVLHARNLRYKLDFSDRNPLYEHYYQRMGIERVETFKNPLLVLAGQQNGVAWEAEIEAISFVIAISAPGVHGWVFG